MRLNVEIYVNDQRLDLFDDENIMLNLNVKNFTDISKVFTDFTQGFTVPASANNNSIFEHWYSADISSGSFNPAVKQTARIELNGIPFRTGVVSLDKASVKGGRVDNYTITFYGDLRSLADLFGEDVLTDLDLSSYEVTFSAYNNSLASRQFSNNVFIPLISPVDTWVYQDPTTVTSTAHGIAYVAGASKQGGIKYIDVKPCIRLARIVDAIEAKYGVTFTSDFFASSAFTRLYMWAHRDAGRTKYYESNYEQMVGTTSSNDGTADPAQFTYDSGNGWFFVKKFNGTGVATVNYAFDIEISTGTNGVIPKDEITYDVVGYDSANGDVLFTQACNGDFVFDVDVTTNLTQDMNVVFGIRSVYPMDYLFTINATGTATSGTVDSTLEESSTALQIEPDKFYFTDGSFTDSFTGETVSVPGNLPQQKVSEFMGGLLQAFNMIVVPTSATTFIVDTWDNWLADGTTVNLNNYVDTYDYEIMPSTFYGEINFKYSPSETALAKTFRDANFGIGYGDLRSEIVDGNGDPLSNEVFDIELPFTNLVYTKLKNITSGGSSNIVVGYSTDTALKPVVGKPVIFYYGDNITLTGNNIGYRDRLSDDLSQLTTYNLAYQFNTATDAFTGSINWGSEINPYTGNDGTSSTPSLYVTYWSDYITDLYDLSARRYTFKGVLPLSFIYGISLNNKIQLGTNLFRINSMQLNLTTGEATLDLLNIIA